MLTSVSAFRQIFYDPIIGPAFDGRKKRVYVAGPYTQGDPILNIRKAIQVGEEILNLGHTPFVPHTNYAWNMLYPHDSQVWYDWDIEWLKVCDVLVRIPGDSVGADKEEEIARDLGIPVIYYEEGKALNL